MIRAMKLKFAANISTMFKEIEHLPERYSHAKAAGFKGVEMQFPYKYNIDEIASAKEKSGLEQVLINSYPGMEEMGELGYASKPHHEKEFLNALTKSIKYAKALNCKKIHILAGVHSQLIHDSTREAAYLENIATAAQYLEQEGMIGLIEPICKQAKPNYFLDSFKQAKKYLNEICCPHLQLQLDLYHLQMMEGNLTENITNLMPHIGHIQISQVPNRNEPNSPGEINYPYILNLLEELGYDGWIGLEYFPSSDSTPESLQWITEYGYSLN